MDRIAERRARYAREILSRAGISDQNLERAFSVVPRENFLGPGPWDITRHGAYRRSATADASEVYVDALIALDRARGINNGEPSAHARWIHALELKPGERVCHIGAGTGYYTAILAELVGAGGRIEAFEIDPALAQRASVALQPWPNAFLHVRSGVEGPLPACDALYVNAGAAEPQAVWLDALAPGGRLEFPLTGSRGLGAMLLIRRAEGERWPARFVSPAGFIDLIGGRPAAAAEAATTAFQGGGADQVRWLERGEGQGEPCWLAGEGWRLL